MEKRKNYKKHIKVIYSFIILIYYIFFFQIVIFKNGITNEFKEVNLIPFKILKEVKVNNLKLTILLKNILGNIFIFIPMGINISKRRSYNILESFLIVFLISLTIEIFQYITGMGITDIDDIIFNTIGGLLGVLLNEKVFNLKNNGDNLRVLFLIIFGLIGLINLWILQPNIIRRNNVRYKNYHLIKGLEIDKPNYSGKILDMDSNIIELLVFKSENETEKKKFKISEMEIILSRKTIEYNSNGMIKEVLIEFDTINLEELKKYFNNKENKIDIWTEDNNIKILILKI